MHAEKLLIWRIKSKIGFCSNFLLFSLDSGSTDFFFFFFYYPSAQGDGIFILNKGRDLLQISRLRLRNQGYQSATWKLDFVTWDAMLDIFFLNLTQWLHKSSFTAINITLHCTSVKNYFLWSIAIRQMLRNGNVNGDETQDLYLPFF